MDVLIRILLRIDRLLGITLILAGVVGLVIESGLILHNTPGMQGEVVAIVLLSIGAILTYYTFITLRNWGPESHAIEAVDPSSSRQRNRSDLPGIFISYRRKDSQYVTGRIYDRLLVEFGREKVFKDVDSIPFGVDFRLHIDKVIKECNVFLVIIGDDWLGELDARGVRDIDHNQDFVRIEIESALEREIPVIPILVEGAEIPVESSMPESIKTLAYRNAIPVRADPDFHNDVDRLIEGIKLLAARQL